MLWDQRALPEVEPNQECTGFGYGFKITGNPLHRVPIRCRTDPLVETPWNRKHFKRRTNSWFPAGIWWPVSPGQFTIDYSRPQRLCLFDIRKKEWHQPFLAALDIPEEKLPDRNLPMRWSER